MSQAALDIMLDAKARQMTHRVDWRNSVVDLLKVLDLDSSKGARERLARRWNVLVGENGDNVRNVALHGIIMDEIAKSQGIVSFRLTAALSVDGYGLRAVHV